MQIKLVASTGTAPTIASAMLSNETPSPLSQAAQVSWRTGVTYTLDVWPENPGAMFRFKRQLGSVTGTLTVTRYQSDETTETGEAVTVSGDNVDVAVQWAHRVRFAWAATAGSGTARLWLRDILAGRSV